MSAESLLNSNNPLKLFHKIWAEYALTPFIESNRRMREENRQKELKIIRALDRQRQRAWMKRDLKWGLLAAA
jgi:hypothetical protein